MIKFCYSEKWVHLYNVNSKQTHKHLKNINMKTYSLNLVKLTSEELKADKEREYNPTEWEKMVGRYVSYTNMGKPTDFYKVPADGKVYSYDRFFAVYTTSDGIRFFAKIGYSSCLSNSSFAKVYLLTKTNEVYVSGYGPEANLRLNSSKEARKLMAQQSKDLDMIFTDEF